jgi:hypothetical protein
MDKDGNIIDENEEIIDENVEKYNYLYKFSD